MSVGNPSCILSVALEEPGNQVSERQAVKVTWTAPYSEMLCLSQQDWRQ